MAANPADIALYTSDGIVVTSPISTAISDAIKVADPNARDPGESVIDSFFDLATDAQALLNEKFDVLSQISPIHEGIELIDTISIGRSIAVTPAVPTFRILDAERAIDGVARLRAYSVAMENDRFSIEVLG